MKTTGENAPVNYTFQRIAALCGLRLSFYVTAALLAIAFLVLTVTDYRTVSPLYILLSLAVLPSLLHAMLFPKEKETKEKNDRELAFPLFCKKYRYSSSFYKALNLAYFLIFLLLAAWHLSYSLATDVPAPVTALPSGIAAVSLLTRLGGVLGYRIYFHLFPLKAMR